MADIFDQIHAQSQSKPQSGSGDIFDQIHTAEQSRNAPAPSPSASLPRNLGHIYTPPLQSSGFFSENGFGPGTFGKGIGEAIQPGSHMKGAHDMFTGAGEMALPLLPSAVIASPAATIGGLVTGAATGVAGKVGSSLAGASPEASDLIGDVSGLAGGYGGGQFGNRFDSRVRMAPPDTIENLKSALINMVPVMGSKINASRAAVAALPKYEPPLPPLGPRPAFQGHDFTPPVFDQSPPVGQPGAVLPSGSVVGPAPPSRINPPLPRGNAPRVPGWQQMPITGERPLPAQDFTPSYPASPILESGHVIGPRPSLESVPNGGTVVNGPQLVAPKVAAKPVISQPDLDVLNQQLRDSLKARGVPQEKPLPSTPSSARANANTSRAKFDENGKRNQLK